MFPPFQEEIMGFKGSGPPRQIRGTVDVGDVGGGSSGDIPVTGGLVSATKTNGTLKSTINITFWPQGGGGFTEPIIHCTILSQGDRDDDNDLEALILDNPTSSKINVYLNKTGAVTQNLKLFVTITEQ